MVVRLHRVAAHGGDVVAMATSKRDQLVARRRNGGGGWLADIRQGWEVGVELRWPPEIKNKIDATQADTAQ